MKFSIKSLTFSCLIGGQNLYFTLKVAQKGKTCSLRLLELQNVAPNAKSCSNVAEHNQDKPGQVASRG